MKDVARKAGVSPGTVCRALNSSPKISVATRERVRKLAESMGYRPDPLVSAFASRLRNKSKTSDITTIAYLTNFRSPDEWRKNSYYLCLFEGFQKRADQLGYRTEHFWAREPGMNGKRLSRILYSRGISSVCIAPLPQVRGHLSLDWEKFSCATMGYSLLRPNLHRTTIHHFHSIMITVRELRKLGYRRIGFCFFKDTNRRVDNLWLSGVLFCEKNMPEIKFSYFLFDDISIREVAPWIQREDLEVVVDAGDEIFLRQLREKKGNGKVDYATLAWDPKIPAIGGIDQRAEGVAAAAVDLIVGQVERGERGLPESPVITMLQGRWVPGESLRRRKLPLEKCL